MTGEQLQNFALRKPLHHFQNIFEPICLFTRRLLDLSNFRGEVGHRRRFEKMAQVQLNSESRAQARDELHRQQGVSAQLEKVVLNAYLFHTQ